MNANIKESHNFENDGDSLKAFIFISVIIRRLSRKIPDVLGKDCRFTNYCRIIIHAKKWRNWLAGKSILDPNDKFSKVRSSIEKANKQCLLQHLPNQTRCVDKSMAPILESMGVNNLSETRPSSVDIKFRLLLRHWDMLFSLILTWGRLW